MSILAASAGIKPAEAAPLVADLMQLPAGDRDQPLAPFGHLGEGCESREEVDRLCAEARAEGRLRGGPTDTSYPVGYWAFIAEPDGHNLEVSFDQDVGLTVERSQPKPTAKLGSEGG